MELTLLIPASYVAETDDPRVRTYKIGQIARAASIFRCDEIVVYDDEPDGGEVISLVLRYAVTPPYLRKEMFERREELRYVGVIPPLRIPPHTVSRESEYRQGVVTKVGSDGRVWVNCGKQHPVALYADAEEGERVSLRISSREPLRAEVVDRSEIPLYWGYEVVRAPLEGWLHAYDGVTVATSRKGETASVEDFHGPDAMAVVFGSPERGVDLILREYYGASYGFDMTVNTIPNQGTETVRTEEAVLATLSLINLAST